MNYLILLFTTLVLNILCGYWRASTKRFSLQWFVFIHLPVPILFILRYFLDVQHSWTKTPILLGVYFAGQLLGIWINKYVRITNSKNPNF